MNDSSDNMMERLKEGTRTMSESRLIRHDDRSKITREDALAVSEQVRRYMSENALANNYLARAIGVSPSTISQLLNHRYMGDWQTLTIDLDRWLDEEIKRASCPRPSDFVWTSVAREIQAIADVSVQMKGIGLVFGQAGFGKTLALQAIAADKAGAIYVSLETIGSNAQAVIETIARAMRVSPGARYASSRHWFEAIKGALRGTSRLLVIDQVHKLCGNDPKDRALYTLCDLYDATGSPQLWCGTEDVIAHLERGEGKGRESLAQIRSRIIISRDLHEKTMGGDGGQGEMLFTIEDIRKVFAGNKLKLTRDAQRYLTELANLPGSGGLRACSRAVLMATLANGGKLDALTEKEITATKQLLAGRRAMQRTMDRMDADRRMMPAAKAG